MPNGRTLGGALFLMSEVPLYRIGVLRLHDHTHLGGHRGTSLIRKRPPVGLSGRPIPTCRTNFSATQRLVETSLDLRRDESSLKVTPAQCHIPTSVVASMGEFDPWDPLRVLESTAGSWNRKVDFSATQRHVETSLDLRRDESSLKVTPAHCHIPTSFVASMPPPTATTEP